MPSVMMPKPENVRGRFGAYVTSDVFHIAERLQEVDRSLFIQALEKPVNRGSGPWNFIVTERVPHADPPDQFVCGVETLDGRLIERIQRMLAIPLSERLAQAEREEAAAKEAEQERQVDEALEDWGWDFRRQLWHDGFITHRGPSYPTKAIRPTREG